MLLLLISCLFVLVGMTAGILSVMFGLGGGFFVVPFLYWIFKLLEFNESLLMHLAIGTSLMIMIFTASRSSYFHYKKSGLLFDPFFKLCPSLIIGTIVATFLTEHLSTYYLRIGFTVFLLYVIVSGLYKHVRRHKKISMPFKMPSALITNSFGFIAGTVAALLGIGGSTITVPFFRHYNLPMIKAVGTASLLTLPISCIGTLGYLYVGHHAPDLPAYTTSFIYWPAAFGIIVGSLIGVPLGGKLVYLCNEKWLEPAYFMVLGVVFLGMII